MTPEPGAHDSFPDELDPEPGEDWRAATPKANAAAHNPRDWRAKLLTKQIKNPITKQVHEVVLSCQANASLILSHHEQWAGLLVYDAFADCVVRTRQPPWPDHETRTRTAPARAVDAAWSDLDSGRLVNWLAREEHLQIGTLVADAAVGVAADALVRHPVCDYLRSLRWDGQPRLDGMLSSHFGADRNHYTEGVSSRWMISAVARVMSPGCQADCTLILESKLQGRGKSTGFEALAGKDLFADSGLAIGDKDSYQNLRSVWIYELGELDAFRGRELTRVKSFLSARSDRYRPSFARRSRDVPRQCVFCGTTNETEYLQDTTGNRRFWPVKVLRQIDVDAIRQDRDQLWAEAVVRYDLGEKWYADTPGFRLLCEGQQEERVRPDVWLPVVRAWLESPTLTEYDPTDGAKLTRTVDIDRGVLIHEVLVGALRKPVGEISRADESRIGSILRTLDYEPTQVREPGGGRSRRYRLAADDGSRIDH